MMNMTDEEILRDYTQSPVKSKKSSILADLNECTKKEIAQDQIDAGEDWYTKKALDVEAIRGAALEVIEEILRQDMEADTIYDRIIGVILLEKRIEKKWTS